MGGSPKALSRVGGTTLAARSMSGWCSAREEMDGMRRKRTSSSGGLHAALAAARTGWIFAAACDMPFLAAGPIRFLAARRGAAPAALVAWDRGPEGLHAFWSRELLPVVDRMVREGNPSIREIAARVGARVVPAEAWREVDPLGRSFENVNSPEDLVRLGLEAPFLAHRGGLPR
jgi:molybdopterin-guanine dinucleotide biosynthesis protein A